MQRIFTVLLLLAIPAHAAKKPPTPPPQYQDGVLISFANVEGGMECSSTGSATASTDSSGTTHADSDGRTSCTNVRRFLVGITSRLRHFWMPFVKHSIWTEYSLMHGTVRSPVTAARPFGSSVGPLLRQVS